MTTLASIDSKVNWPPVHSIRRSPRARFASLKISPRNGLEVILPTRYKLKDVPDLLNKKRNWIEKNVAILQQFAQRQNLELPKEISLRGLGEVWQIKYLFSPIKTCVISTPEQQMTVLGNIDDSYSCFIALRDWLLQKAFQFLPPILYDLSRELRLPFQDLNIRGQKTRWGSCSSQKIINLNFKLIFLPPEIVRHIMIHELCHTVHLNHSRKFWQLVARHDPNWQNHQKISRRMSDQVPSWVED